MYTKIDDLFWKDRKVKHISDDSKLVFFYLMTCPHRTMLGMFHLPIGYSTSDMGWDAKRFTKSVDELVKCGFICCDMDAEVIFVKNYIKYNKIENPNQVKAAVNALLTIQPNGCDAPLMSVLEGFDERLYEPLMERLLERLRKGLPEPLHEPYAKPETETEDRNRKQKQKAETITETKTEYAPSVKMTGEEHKKLLSQFGEKKVKWMCEKLSNMKISSGKTYKSDYHAILNWVVDAYEKANPQESQSRYPVIRAPEGWAANE